MATTKSYPRDSDKGGMMDKPVVVHRGNKATIIDVHPKNFYEREPKLKDKMVFEGVKPPKRK